MTKRVLVVSHADADGHVIAEQVRRNLEAVHAFDVATLIDPVRTKDHKAWTHLDRLPEIESRDLIFFVDLMFAPSSFGAEADALVRFANAHPSKLFFVLDHHPLPLRRLEAAPNVRAIYRHDVYECTFGEPSWMMIVAALCEKQPSRAKNMKNDSHDMLALGLRRAAALGGPLPGEKLLALLRHDRWSDIAALGAEEKEKHKLPRGRRSSKGIPSDKLAQLDRTATELLRSQHADLAPGGSTMAYDFDAATDRSAPEVTTPAPQAKDLEAIVMLLELAAIYLTPTPDVEFSLADLIAEARKIGGPEVPIDEGDAEIVVEKAAFLKKTAKKRFRLK